MKFLFSLLLICCSLMSFSQVSTIKLQNPSFEDSPRKGGQSNKIKGWYDCGRINFPDESAPDIHPMDFWKVQKEASDGKTYLGLVVRDNDSWESVSQKLATEKGVMTPMLGGVCYQLSMNVAQSEVYMSGSRLQLTKKGDKKQTYNYTTPAVIRIWGGNSFCNKRELLAKSDPIFNREWQTIELEFVPTSDSDFIIVEAYYNTPVVAPYNGHVLLDNLSDIIQVDCKE